ncbi:hypothetical protein SAY87_010434 [Trapa incisa]|uniref:Bifunctional inhibitor/plant lipid transfer protein/seed storage helical domain-containing protein n=1 Tax=Trapa incisa TaxID=236973 RepID=A0AAN7GQG2_9MYRT|nr:hypothetical protein SAY87_010434 [Trapa incisa]
MERKLTILAMLLSVMFVTASAYRTIVTTVVEEEDDSETYQASRREGIRESCREQIRKQHNLVHCQQVLSRGSKLIMLAGDETNAGQLKDCCQQLRQVEERCRCQGIEKILQVQQKQGKLQGRRLREAIQTGENLPNMCRMSPQSCDISVGSGYDGYHE